MKKSVVLFLAVVLSLCAIAACGSDEAYVLLADTNIKVYAHDFTDMIEVAEEGFELFIDAGGNKSDLENNLNEIHMRPSDDPGYRYTWDGSGRLSIKQGESSDYFRGRFAGISQGTLPIRAKAQQ